MEDGIEIDHEPAEKTRDESTMLWVLVLVLVLVLNVSELSSCKEDRYNAVSQKDRGPASPRTGAMCQHRSRGHRQ